MYEPLTLYRIDNGSVNHATRATELYFTITEPDGVISLHPLRQVIDTEIERVRQAAIDAYHQQAEDDETGDELSLLLVPNPQPKTN